MQYKSFYRKYRPNSFAEIISQENIVAILKNSIHNNTFSHAYLFSGVKGTGKTSTAKIFAKAINCQKNEQGDVCNTCQNCRDINSTNCIDILEIDGASNNGVDEIRNIKDNINLLPMNFKYKIYIIDEVHMLTTPAFNALLKTLEEPPQHVIFILATTEPYKVLPTIISRCQWFEFKKIKMEAMETQFIKVLQQEHISFEPEALFELALLSDGSLRDGLNHLEKVVNYSNDVTLKSVEKIFSVLSNKNKVKFLINIFNSDIEQVMIQLELFNEYTIDYKKFIIDFIYIIEDIIIYNLTKKRTPPKTITIAQVMLFSEVAKADLYLILNSFNEVLTQENINDLKPILILKILNLFTNFSTNYVLKDDESINFEIKVKNDDKLLPVIKKVEKEEVSSQEILTKVVKHVSPPINKKVIVNNNLITKTKVKTDMETPPLIKKEMENKQVNEQNNFSDVLDTTNCENNAIITKAINLILQADKNIRKEINNKWNKINDFINDNKFRNITKIYLNTLVTAATKNAFIVIAENIIQANLINERFLSKEHRLFLTMLLGQEYMVYALDKKQWQATRKKYQYLLKNNLLPTPVEIVITEPTVETFDNSDKDPTLAFIQKIFTEVEEI